MALPPQPQRKKPTSTSSSWVPIYDESKTRIVYVPSSPARGGKDPSNVAVATEMPVQEARKKKLPPNHSILFTRSVKRKGDDTNPLLASTTTTNISGKKRKEPPQDWKPTIAPVASERRRRRASSHLVYNGNGISLAKEEQLVDLGEFAPLARDKQLLAEPELLMERNEPRTFEEIVGQRDAIEKIKSWCLRPGTTRGLLLVGQSGVGKSVMTKLAATFMGVKSYPFHPCKADLLCEEEIKSDLSQMAFRSDAFEKFCIVLEDVGPISKEAQKALVAILAPSSAMKSNPPDMALKQKCAPIFMTCNDEDLDKLTMVARHCCVVHLLPLDSSELLTVCDNVCNKEGLDLSSDVKGQIVEGCGGDVRRMLNMLQFYAIHATSCHSSGEDSLFSAQSVFYNHHSNMEVVRKLLQAVKDKTALSELEDMLDAHPVSLELLLAQNYPHLVVSSESWKNVASVADHFSECDLFDSATYGELEWELQEVCTAISTWGSAVLISHSVSDLQHGKGVAEDDLHVEMIKSELYSWKQREAYRRKWMATCEAMHSQGRGIDFISYGALLCEHLKSHTAKKPQLELVARLKEQKFSYKDLQDIWRASILRETTFPNPRGKNSLKKLLK